MGGSRPGRMPSTVSADLSRFDRFAQAVSQFVSRSLFFAFAVALVVVWAPTYPLWRSFDTWQLVINTPTTVGTWLLVALLQNSGRRSDQAVQHKLNAMAAGLAETMDAISDEMVSQRAARRLRDATVELRKAVGLEERESS